MRMSKCLFLSFAFSAILGFGFQTSLAQFPIKIPSIPKTDKTKPKPPPAPAESEQPEAAPATQPAAQPRAADGPDTPTIIKDSLQVTAYTHNFYRGKYDMWSWVPVFKYRVNGPIPSGSQLYVEYTIPGGGSAVSFDCDTGETQKGYWWGTECGGRGIPDDKSSTYTGPVNFAIKMRNELSGTDSTIYTGRMKVAKTRSSGEGPKAANEWVYYVDHDWNLPIGYIYYEQDSVYGWNYPTFNIAFWVRGEATSMDPHLFYQGKEIGRVFNDGLQVGKASCASRVDIGTTHFVNTSQMPQEAKWRRVECTFYMVKQWDKTGGQPNSNEMFLMASNPGEYEFKVLWKNKLARSIKFTVGPNGNLDNGIAASNGLGNDRVIVPVQIIGDHDGQWDKNAWKTEAFYGNALAGFTPPQ